MTRGKRTAARKPLVEWREGVHLVGTPLWFDALRTREVCFVASARVGSIRKHRQIVATAATLALLPEARGGRGSEHLAVPYGRPFSLGTLRLELFPSGAMLGAASLAVDVGGRRVVYAGAVNPRGGGLGGPAEVRACDVLVVEARFADQTLPAPDHVFADLRAFVEAARAESTTPVVLVDSVGAALDVAAALGGEKNIRAHRAYAAAVRKAAELGAELPRVKVLAGAPGVGEVVLWPVASRNARALSGPRRLRLAAVGGWAADPAVVVRLKAERGFPYAAQADRPALLEYIAQSGAREVHLLAGSESLVGRLRKQGLDARVLAPPTQLPLF